MTDTRSAARDRERESNKKPPKGQSERLALSSLLEIKRELARLKSSYEVDLVSANAWRDHATAPAPLQPLCHSHGPDWLECLLLQDNEIM